jgi:hypothetical protein
LVQRTPTGFLIDFPSFVQMEVDTTPGLLFTEGGVIRVPIIEI